METFWIKLSLLLTEMEGHELIYSNEVCRLCLSSEPVISIFKNRKTVLQMISSLCLVIVSENDNMPSKICIQCLKLLQQFTKFREKCLETDRILQKQNNIVFTSDPFKTEPNDDFYTEGTIKIEPCDDFVQDDDDYFKADINSVSDKQYHSDQSEDWFEKYFEEAEPKSKKQNKEKQYIDLEENTHIVCHICGHSVRRDSISTHVSRHTTERKHSCSICPAKFKTRDTLKKHMKAHNDNRVTCDVCKRSLAHLSSLKSHIEYMHSTPVKSKCDICGKIYKNKLLLKCHRRRHEKRFQCQYCDSMFADITSKKEHERLHTGETPYKCPSCPKAYAQLPNMKSHFKHNHKDIVFSEVYKPVEPSRKKYTKNTETPKDGQ